MEERFAGLPLCWRIRSGSAVKSNSDFEQMSAYADEEARVRLHACRLDYDDVVRRINQASP
jgi:hypothetical protein